MNIRSLFACISLSLVTAISVCGQVSSITYHSLESRCLDHSHIMVGKIASFEEVHRQDYKKLIKLEIEPIEWLKGDGIEKVSIHQEIYRDHELEVFRRLQEDEEELILFPVPYQRPNEAVHPVELDPTHRDSVTRRIVDAKAYAEPPDGVSSLKDWYQHSSSKETNFIDLLRSVIRENDELKPTGSVTISAGDWRHFRVTVDDRTRKLIRTCLNRELNDEPIGDGLLVDNFKFNGGISSLIQLLERYDKDAADVALLQQLAKSNRKRWRVVRSTKVENGIQFQIDFPVKRAIQSVLSAWDVPIVNEPKQKQVVLPVHPDEQATFADPRVRIRQYEFEYDETQKFARIPVINGIDSRGVDRLTLDISKLVALRRLNLSYLRSGVDLVVSPENKQVVELDLSGGRIKAYPFISQLKSLKRLRLDGSEIENLAPLAELTQLEFLSLNSTHVSDLAPLANLTNLRELEIANSNVENLDALGGLKKLTRLKAYSESLKDLSGLAGCKGLKDLDISSTQVADLSPLKGCTSLERLRLSGSKIQDLKGLESLEHLKTLELDNTGVDDLSPLQDCTSLVNLSLNQTKVDDLEALSKLVNLKNLSVDNTAVTSTKGLESLTELTELRIQGIERELKLDSVNYLPNLKLIGNDRIVSQLASEVRRTCYLDHHVHLLSPQLLADWKSIGMRFSRADASYVRPQTVIQRAGSRKAIAVSMAYLYSSRWFQRDERFRVDEVKRVERENNFIAKASRESEGKLIGFFAVNPVADYAMGEAKRCIELDGIGGVKLHLPASGVDLNDKSDWAKLTEMFRFCNDQGLPILMHLDGLEGDFGLVEARRFWTDLVAPNKNLKLIIAHLGSSGGFNSRSAALLASFEELQNKSQLPCSESIYFDLSGAILHAPLEGLPATSEQRVAELAKLMRKIGLSHFVPASDYPALSVNDFRRTLEKLKLTPNERRLIQKNVATFLKR